jgi:hypothetical protein
MLFRAQGVLGAGGRAEATGPLGDRAVLARQPRQDVGRRHGGALGYLLTFSALHQSSPPLVPLRSRRYGERAGDAA